MSPRYLGGRLVVARSFARLHLTNLKKQGILPCTFAKAADFDTVRAGDRISVAGLSALAPGRALTATLHHADGRAEPLELRHSMTEEQIRWFKAGAALNLLSSPPHPPASFIDGTTTPR